MLGWMIAASLAASPAVAQEAAARGAEARVVEYLRQNVRPGQRVVVSDLYNDVFTSGEERAALDRMFNAFFKIPLFAAQYRQARGRPPSLAEIAEQFRFAVPGQADVLLRVMESDPRMPRFLERSAETGEIRSVDVQAVLAHPRFGKLLERSIAGFAGRPAAPFAVAGYDGSPLASAELAGKPYLLYFWFSDCPPCLKTAPLLSELYAAYHQRGLELVALNADRVLEIAVGDAERSAYVRKNRLPFRFAHSTPELLESYGQVSVFPTFFFVDGQGTIVQHLVGLQDKAALEAGVRLALE